MTGDPFWNIDRLTGLILVLSNIALLPGLLMFWFRGGQRGGAPRSRAHYVWERSFIIAFAVLTAIGFVLFQGIFQDSTAQALAKIAASAYFFGSVLLVAGEALGLNIGYEKSYGLIVIYVVIAFLAQAVFGGVVLLSGLVSAWIGWVSILWNIVWLVVLPLISPHDLYFPVLHSITPLLIGIALLLK